MVARQRDGPGLLRLLVAIAAGMIFFVILAQVLTYSTGALIVNLIISACFGSTVYDINPIAQ